MRKPYIPRAFFGLVQKYMSLHPRCNLLIPMGFGKTSLVLFMIKARMFGGLINKSLVIAPKRVAVTTWPEEAAKWEGLEGLRVEMLEWTNAEIEFLKLVRKARSLQKRDPKRKELATKQAFKTALAFRPAAIAARLRVIHDLDVMTVNYDKLLDLMLILQEVWPFDLVVADESTRLKHFRLRQGAKRAGALALCAHISYYWLNLSGTFNPNGMADVWGQLWFVDHGERLGHSFTAFEDRYFGFARRPGDRPKTQYVDRVLFPHSTAEIMDKIKDVCLSLNVKDYFDVDEPIVSPVYVDLPDDVRVVYDAMQKKLFASLKALKAGDHTITARSIASKSMKCLQIASGACYVDETDETERGAWEKLHDEKLDALESIIEEAGGAPVLVAYHFRHDLVRLQARFPRGRTLDAKPATQHDWNAGRIPILFAHPASAGHGLNLQDGGNILVYFSHWWDAELRGQILERIGPVRQFQAGHPRPVFVYNIIARRTVDESVIEATDNKRDMMEVLSDAMKEEA